MKVFEEWWSWIPSNQSPSAPDSMAAHFFTESNWSCDESHRGRQGKELWGGLSPVPAWRGVFPTCYQMWVTLGNLMDHFSAVGVTVSGLHLQLFHPPIFILQTRPMATGRRREYGPSVCSTWTELRRSRTFSRIKKNRGRNLSKSHREMTSMWSGLCHWLRKRCHTLEIKYVWCASVCVRQGVTAIAKVKIQRKRNCKSSLWVRNWKLVSVPHWLCDGNLCSCW